MHIPLCSFYIARNSCLREWPYVREGSSARGVGAGVGDRPFCGGAGFVAISAGFEEGAPRASPSLAHRQYKQGDAAGVVPVSLGITYGGRRR